MCEYDNDPDCGPDIRVLAETTPVAQRQHACTDCPSRGWIDVGTRYRKAVLILDGEFTIDRRCFDEACIRAISDAALAEFIAERDRAVAAGDLPF